MTDPKNTRVTATVLLASLAGLATGFILGGSYGHAPLDWRTIILCAPVIWSITGDPDSGCFYWLTFGTALLYGVYALAVKRYQWVGTACVVVFHGFFVAVFAAIVLLGTGPPL